MRRSGRKYILLVILLLMAMASIVWLRTYVFDNMGVSLQKRIHALSLSGFNVTYDSIGVNWLTGTVEINNLLLEKNAYDTTCIYPEFISVKKVRAEGIGMFQLLFRNSLAIETLYLDSSRLIMRQNSLFKLDSAAQRENEFTLQVERVFLTSANYIYTDSIECKVIVGLKSNIRLADVDLNFRLDKPFTYTASEILIDSGEITLPAQFYSFRVRRAKMNVLKKTFSADSIQILPSLGKIEFGRKHGFEIDRFEGFIPFVKANNFSFSFLDSAHLKSDVAEIQFYLKVFRDKRLPFVRKQKLLPIAQLNELSFDLAIDSLKVTKSYVEYEEYAEGTVESGRVFFDNLYAILHRINNVEHAGNTTLSAHASLLGHGEVDVFATFPIETNKRSSVKGSIKNFSIPEINSMLTPSTQMKIESGQMKELSFNFTFNSIRSEGEIGLNYENLKVITFKDEAKSKGDKPEKDNLKSFIMNTFVFKKNMDEDVPEEKRQGTIMYVRDQTRSIFNFWCKSLISGIKSAYNLDKAEAKKSERESRKEQRLSKREARKLKRAEKKKERG